MAIEQGHYVIGHKRPLEASNSWRILLPPSSYQKLAIVKSQICLTKAKVDEKSCDQRLQKLEICKKERRGWPVFWNYTAVVEAMASMEALLEATPYFIVFRLLGPHKGSSQKKGLCSKTPNKKEIRMRVLRHISTSDVYSVCYIFFYQNYVSIYVIFQLFKK